MIARSETERRAIARGGPERRMHALEMVREQLGTTPAPPAPMSGPVAAALAFVGLIGPAMVLFALIGGAP